MKVRKEADANLDKVNDIASNLKGMSTTQPGKLPNTDAGGPDMFKTNAPSIVKKEALHPNQRKLDVAPPKGKLTAADFAKLRKEEVEEEVEEGYIPPSRPKLTSSDSKSLEKTASLMKRENDKHFEKQTPKMQTAINLHLRKGKSYADAAKAAKVHVKEETIDENLGKGIKKMKFWYGTTSSGDPRGIKQRLKDDPEFAKKLANRTDKVSGPAELQRRLAKKMQKEESEIEEGFVVRYNNPKSEKHGNEKHFDDQVAAKNHAARGNLIDKVGGKYTVHKTNEKGHDVKEEALDELSKATLGSYAAKAHKQGDMAARMSNGGQKKDMSAIANKRYKGVQTAIKKLREINFQIQYFDVGKGFWEVKVTEGGEGTLIILKLSLNITKQHLCIVF
jgi:hypothetical protein